MLIGSKKQLLEHITEVEEKLEEMGDLTENSTFVEQVIHNALASNLANLRNCLSFNHRLTNFMVDEQGLCEINPGAIGDLEFAGICRMLDDTISGNESIGFRILVGGTDIAEELGFFGEFGFFHPQRF